MLLNIVWLCICEEMDWDKFDMNPRVIAAIKKANITSIKDIFHLSGSDLQRLTKLSKTDVQYLLRTISTTLRKNSVFTALQLFQNKAPSTSQGQKLSLGCPFLDGLLRGGIPRTGITEIAGESSAGKTQIALQLCLSVQYPYRYGGLESATFLNINREWVIGEEVVSLTRTVARRDTFHECITKRLSLLLSRGMVRLIIIDSIAALFRCEFSATDSLQKAKYLQKFGAKLHRLSCTFQTPIICINQVTDAINVREDAVWNTQSCSARTVVPALGITWSNQLLMRLMVCRTVNQALTGGETLYSKSELRMLRIIFAPHLPQHFCYYTVNLEGVKGVGKISHDYEET
ncbi:PREDICTED: DNA repair protein XRCC3 [Thamnophis sirtalis]|uniref:DNA repair protein XRCC3 n=1 Tax=Thamnophis sirtalis TaxID=35019 RepID=A0A6I9YWP5_9SAUR|nr:PREDICTED: DNA repair protein XRCC3 [Thamnophis sirtalis]